MTTDQTRPRFGYVTRLKRFADVSDVARVAEESGFDRFALGDTHTMFGDPYVMLGLAAAATSHLEIGTLVTNPSSRHPAAIANAIATIDDISGGRAFLGLGSGDNAVLNLGLARATLAEMDEAITAIRGLTAGREVTLRGRKVLNRWAHRPVPIVMSAEGPRALRLAGRVADGVLIGTGLSEENVRRSVAFVAEGADGAGRSMSEIEVWFLARWALADDRDAALAQLASLMASVGHHALRGDPAAKGVPEELVPLIHELDRRYDPSHHNVPGASPNALLVRELGLLEYLADRFAIAGTGKECADQVMRLQKLGVDNIFLTMANTGDPLGELRAWSGEVIARLPSGR
ncbi:MAG: LLM class flavin-dependent oxidoreductase [Acidimicrobiales bacterium]|nr:LLM class flavin-dependent oxidoreductase [Acidimicrobiales bacterium]